MMTAGHDAILDFLQMVERVKGPYGQVALHCIHWRREAEERQQAISARGFTYAGDPAVKPDLRITSEKTGEPVGENLAIVRDGPLYVDDFVRFEGISPVSGYVHLFNLGCGGTCPKLAPSEEFPDNRVRAHSPFHVPSEQFLSASLLAEGHWYERGPTTAETGHPERLFAVVTRDDIDLQIEDLHTRLLGEDVLTRCAARGPAFKSPVKTGKTKLFQLSPDQWEYGLVAMEVRSRPVEP